MADRIKGITVEIGGDTTKLSSALKGVNSQLKSTQAALKDVDKQLKFDPTNTELLRQKQKLLADAVKETKDKLEQLNEAEKQLKKAGVDENSEQFMALRREIIETENNLKDLEKQARNSNAVMSEIGAVAGKVSEGANKVAEKTRAMSAAAATALAGIGAIGIKAAQSADELNTLAKQTGLSTEMLQKAQYAADLIDVSFETFTSSIAKMEGKLRTSEDSFTNLGIATRDVNGNMLSTEEIFRNSAQALSQIGNETERDIAAQSLFGKSAAELSGILDDGGAALEEYGKQAEEMGLIMDQDTVDSLNAVNDQLDTMKANLKGTLAKSGAKALKALTPVLKAVSDALGKVLEWVGKLSPDTIKLIAIVLAVIAAISPIAKLIAGISAAINFLCASPIVLIIAAIAAVIAIVVLCIKHWDEIKKKITEVVDKIKEKVIEMKDKVVNKFNEMKENTIGKVKEIKDNAVAKFQEIKDKVVGKVQEIKDKVKDKFDQIKEKITTPIQEAKDKVKGFVDEIQEFFDNMKAKLPDIKLPHFTVSYSVPKTKVGKAVWKDFLGLEGKPNIGVDWYAKAMNNAMILKSPTIFGAMNGKMLGGGEAGAEVVSGANTLMNMIRSAVAEEVNNSASISLLKQIASNTGASTSIDINNREFGRLVKAVI